MTEEATNISGDVQNEMRSRISNIDDLRAWIIGANDEQLYQWVRLEAYVRQFQNIVPSLGLGEEEEQQVQEALARAHHHLDYRRPYTITVVGVSGAGKSTLINALLGRRLVKFKYGRPTTGTVVTIAQTPADGSMPPYEQAIIRYHSRESLAEIIQAQCALSGTKPAYVANDPQQGIDFMGTLELVRTWKSHEVGAMVCPGCKEENRPGANVCGYCGAPLPKQSKKTTGSKSEVFVALEDLLETAHLQEARLGTEEVLSLDNSKQERQVQELMDEESLINKDRDRRVIPLIQSIEYRIRLSDNLPHVNLVDVPGAAARATLHEQHMREQLNPFKTDAILLVMPPDRPELLSNQLLPLVKDVLMAGLTPDQRRIAAGRIFLIVSKGDVVHGMSEQEAEQGTRENVEKVAREIASDFFQRHTRNTFFDVKALPGLTAQLMLEDPPRGRLWLHENKDDPLFRDISRSHYQDCIARSHAQSSEKTASDDMAVLTWSRIPELQKTLREFLGRSRWQHALYEASSLYNNAHTIITERVNSRWIELTGRPFSDNADEDLANLTTDRSVRYGEKLQADVHNVLEHFEHACDELKRRNNRERLRIQVQHITHNVQRKIEQHVRRPEFRESFASTIEDPIYDDLYTLQGVPGPLIDLQTRVFRWFDEDVYRVTETMMTAFQQELDREQVETLLQNFCYNDFYIERYLTPYHDDIIGLVRADYESACRGAMLYQMFHRKVALEVMKKNSTFGQVLTQEGSLVLEEESGGDANSSEGGMIESLIENIIIQYQEAHRDLVEALPHHLTFLFFYHLTLARDQMHGMIKNLSTRLAQDVRDPKCPIYQQLQEAELGLKGGAENLVKQWKQLGELRLRNAKKTSGRSRSGSSNGSRSGDKR